MPESTLPGTVAPEETMMEQPMSGIALLALPDDGSGRQQLLIIVHINHAMQHAHVRTCAAGLLSRSGNAELCEQVSGR